MLRSIVAAALFIAALFAADARAASLQEAWELRQVGRFHAAARVAERVPGPAGLAMAASAMLEQAMWQAPARKRIQSYRRALELAQAALARDPESGESYRVVFQARMHLARLGAEHRDRQWFDDMLTLVDRALAYAPSAPLSHAALGCWHSETVAANTAGMAVNMHGASYEGAVGAFQSGLSLDPAHALALLEYARSVARVAGGNAAIPILRRLISLKPDDAVGSLSVDLGWKALNAGTDAAIRQVLLEGGN